MKRSVISFLGAGLIIVIVTTACGGCGDETHKKEVEEAAKRQAEAAKNQAEAAKRQAEAAEKLAKATEKIAEETKEIRERQERDAFYKARNEHNELISKRLKLAVQKCDVEEVDRIIKEDEEAQKYFKSWQQQLQK